MNRPKLVKNDDKAMSRVRINYLAHRDLGVCSSRCYIDLVIASCQQKMFYSYQHVLLIRNNRRPTRH